MFSKFATFILVYPAFLVAITTFAMVGFFELKSRTNKARIKDAIITVFKKNSSFDVAFQAFLEGKPIRRLSSSTGCIKQTQAWGNEKK